MKIENFKIKQLPRLRGDNATALFCWDDCIASYANFVNVPYEWMYFDILKNEFIPNNGSNPSPIGSRLVTNNRIIENLNLYSGIFTQYYNENVNEAKATILKQLKNNIPILICIQAFYCPWDWRYQEVEIGEHNFFIIGIDEQTNSYICSDPYYQMENQSLPIDMFELGYRSLTLLDYKALNEPIDELNILKQRVKALYEDKYFEAMKDFASEIARDFNLELEIIDYNLKQDNSYDDLKDRIILNHVLTNISNNRIRYAVLLKRIALGNDSVCEQLMKLAEQMVYMAEKWEAVRFMLIKRVMVKKIDKISEYLSNKILSIIADDEELASNIIRLLEDTPQIGEENIENVTNDKIESIVFVNIQNMCNNQGIGSLRSNKADLSDTGEYFWGDLFPNNNIIEHNEMKFILSGKEEENKDNICCMHQEIIVEKDHYKNIMFLGCAEWGNFTDDVKLIYSDGSKETLRLSFNDWIPNLEHGEPQNTAWKSKVVVRNVNGRRMSDIQHRLYAQSYKIDFSKIACSIILPECANMHIFAISLGK